MTFLLNFKLQRTADGKFCADAARLGEQTMLPTSQAAVSVRRIRLRCAVIDLSRLEAFLYSAGERPREDEMGRMSLEKLY